MKSPNDHLYAEMFTEPASKVDGTIMGTKAKQFFTWGEESPCVQALQVYLEEKGVDVNGES